jgi:metal-sulfur cluster biosynthetic enzyme
MVDKKQIMAVLKECIDPEISINVVDLGLIYDVNVIDGNVDIKMALTSPGCPMQFFILEDIKKRVSKMKGVKEVSIDLVFDPPWSPDRMSRSAKKKLGWSSGKI